MDRRKDENAQLTSCVHSPAVSSPNATSCHTSFGAITWAGVSSTEPGRRARRHAHDQGDRAAPLRPPHTQALRRRAEGGVADAPLLGRRRPTSTTGAACGNAVAGRGYFGVLVPAQPPNGLSEL
jgi:hypothetical protein